MSNPVNPRPIDWNDVRRVLVVRLRSIGDAVLATPTLTALKKFLPAAQIDILLEDWVAPMLRGHEHADNVLSVGKGGASRMKTAWLLRRNRYDAAFNLHGGTTGTFFTFASGARHRVGYAEYQYSFLYNHLLTSAADFWQKPHTHSVEQQLALPGSVGVPVDASLRTSLPINEAAMRSVESRLPSADSSFALIHPAAAFATKQWDVEKFARTAEYLAESGLAAVAVAARSEVEVLNRLRFESAVPIAAFSDLTLPEITALASRSSVFVGNDSGIAHIAAAVNTPSVVIFGSSNIHHWRPWTKAPNEVVFQEYPCQPCPGYECKVFGEARCIADVTVSSVTAAIDRVMNEKGRA